MQDFVDFMYFILIVCGIVGLFVALIVKGIRLDRQRRDEQAGIIRAVAKEFIPEHAPVYINPETGLAEKAKDWPGPRCEMRGTVQRVGINPDGEIVNDFPDDFMVTPVKRAGVDGEYNVVNIIPISKKGCEIMNAAFDSNLARTTTRTAGYARSHDEHRFYGKSV